MNAIETLLYCFYIIFLIQSHQKKIRPCTVHPMSTTFIVDFSLVSTAIQRLYFILWILISKLRVFSSCHLIPYQALDQYSGIRFPYPLAAGRNSQACQLGEPNYLSQTLLPSILSLSPSSLSQIELLWGHLLEKLHQECWLLLCLSHICSWVSSKLPACCC